MTGYRSKYFRHDCGKCCYVQALPLWDDIIECFPRKIRPTDIDGMVEINGKVLILEEKSAGKSLEEGQRRALKALWKTNGVTLIVFRPVANSDAYIEAMILANDLPKQGYQKVARAWLLDWIREWAEAAERGV